MKILVFDKDYDLADALKSLLEFKCHEVKVCNDVVSAISICKLFNPQLLISEYLPSDKNYMHLFKSIYEKNFQTKTMLLTDVCLSLNESTKLQSLGIDCLLAKPIHPDVIINTVDLFEKSLERILHH